LGIALYLPVLGSIGYWEIFSLAVIRSTDTAQTSWHQRYGSCRAELTWVAGYIPRWWDNQQW